MNKKHKTVITCMAVILVIFVIYLFNASFSSFIDNGERIEEGSNLS